MRRVLWGLISCFIFVSSATASNNIIWITPDFFIETGGDTQDISHHPLTTTDCRPAIPSKLCLVKSFETRRNGCLPGSEDYAVHFEALYDEYPPLLNKAMCSLKRIYVIEKFFASAIAGNMPEGPVIGIR